MGQILALNRKRTVKLRTCNYFGIESTGSTAMDLIDALSENKRLSTTLEMERLNTSNVIKKYERKLEEQRENWTKSDLTSSCQENIWPPGLTLHDYEIEKEKSVKWSNFDW